MIALIDYGAGNLTSVKKALAAVGAEVFVPARPDELAAARGLIVPGVGHFGATRALDGEWTATIRSRLNDGCPLLGICLGMQWLYESSDEAPELKGLGVLPGRIVRLQPKVRLKADATYGGNREVRLKPDATYERIEEVRLKPDATYRGNREVRLKADATTEDGTTVREDPYVASGFSRTSSIKVPHVGWNSLTLVHEASVTAGVTAGAQVYFTHSYVAPVTADTAAITEHGEPFAAIVQRGRIAGVQFHPEKSGDIGLLVLRNFVLLTSTS